MNVTQLWVNYLKSVSGEKKQAFLDDIVRMCQLKNTFSNDEVVEYLLFVESNGQVVADMPEVDKWM